MIDFESPEYMDSATERFFSCVVAGPNNCWIRTGNSCDGYNRFNFKGRGWYAHIWLYTQMIGPVPAGLDLDHMCHNLDESCLGGPTCIHRRCVNLDHLVPSTRAENLRRGRKGKTSREMCLRDLHSMDEHSYTSPDGSRYCVPCKLAAVRRRKAARVS